MAMQESELQARFDGVYEVVARMCREPKLVVTKGDVETLVLLDDFLERKESVPADVLYEFRLLLASWFPLMKEGTL